MECLTDATSVISQNSNLFIFWRYDNPSFCYQTGATPHRGTVKMGKALALFFNEMAARNLLKAKGGMYDKSI